MSITLYGIKNCDTVRKAKKWLDAKSVEYAYHDFRDDGLDSQLVDLWLKQVDLSVLLNKRSTTWKQLSEDEKSNPSEQLLTRYPTLIKRPVLSIGASLEIGFSESNYESLLKEHTL